MTDNLPSEQATAEIHRIRAGFWNCDCVEGMSRLPAGCADLVVADPPYGIADPESSYNRKQSEVLKGYVEAPNTEDGYREFTRRWLNSAIRLLRPGGSIYVVSGWTFGYVVKAELHQQGDLREINEIVWKYQFGVRTTRKFVSSHYNIYFWEKKGGRRTFNTGCRFQVGVKDENRRSPLYRDLEDVWTINRPYRRGRVKNRNQLPEDLVAKILEYSSNPGDLVLDPFLGGFTTARVARRLGRRCIGFEINPNSFVEMVRQLRVS